MKIYESMKIYSMLQETAIGLTPACQQSYGTFKGWDYVLVEVEGFEYRETKVEQ